MTIPETVAGTMKPKNVSTAVFTLKLKAYMVGKGKIKMTIDRPKVFDSEYVYRDPIKGWMIKEEAPQKEKDEFNNFFTRIEKYREKNKKILGEMKSKKHEKLPIIP